MIIFPIYKRCLICNKRILANEKCKCSGEKNRHYNTRNDNQFYKFYHCNKWKELSRKVVQKYGAIDIYSYYIYKLIEYGQIVHHVIPIKEDWERRFDESNLIYLTASNHQLIHKQMKEGKKEEVENLLFTLIKKFEGGI